MRPSAVPLGTRTPTLPSNVGTESVVPKANSVKLTGTVTVRSSPSRPKTLSGRTCTVTYRSPDGAPRNPASPCPASRIRCPSTTPGGIRTLMVRLRVVTPVPLHSSQGCSMIDPLPRQSVHGSEKPKAPWLRLITPAPLHVGQTLGLVPGRAPLPWQLVHGAGLVSRNGIATPLVASRKSSSVSVSKSLPRRGRLGRGCAPRPNSPPNRSPMLLPPLRPAASNRSLRLNSAPSPPTPKPPAKSPPPPPLKRRPNPPPAKSRRVSSYSLRLAGSVSTSFASETALYRSSAAALSGLRSGWFSASSLRATRLISSWLASEETPS